MTRTAALVLTLNLVALSLFAGDGKWTPQQVLELGPTWVREQGMELPLEKLWDADAGGGLLANAIGLVASES